MTNQLLTVAITLPHGIPPETALAVARMAGRLGFAAVHLDAGQDVDALDDLDALVSAAAPARVAVGVPPDGTVATADPQVVRAARAALDASGTDRPLLVAVPISIGRTMGEAVARAEREPRFASDRNPESVGIFGTFTHAQEHVLALARAGADGLLLDIPIERDVADVLAQIRALVVGATPALATATEGRDVPAPRTVFYG